VVDLAVTSDQHWATPTPELAKAAAAAGFTSMGISADRIDADTPAAYADAGLRCDEVMALLFTDDADATVAAAEHLAAQAKAIGARWVLTVFTVAVTSEYERALRRCAEVFADAGAGMAIEFSPLGPVASIDDGMAVLRAATRGSGRAGLMIDSWHFCHSSSTWSDLAAVPLDAIAYVQFADALPPADAGQATFRETLHRRALPGHGVLDLDRFAATLLERGLGRHGQRRGAQR
jgi:sugar phosphate isomerase/epimerase